MKKNILTLFLSTSLMIASLAWATDSTDLVKVADTTFTTSTKLGDQGLQLYGAGLRTKYTIKVYALGVYVPGNQLTLSKKNKSANDLLNAMTKNNSSELAELHMLRKVDADEFVEALDDGLEDNSPKKTREALKAEIKQLKDIMLAAKEVKKGDIIKFAYDPAQGTQVSINGNNKGTIGGGITFYTMILKIWLGDDPVDKDLKKDILGRH